MYVSPEDKKNIKSSYKLTQDRRQIKPKQRLASASLVEATKKKMVEKVIKRDR